MKRLNDSESEPAQMKRLSLPSELEPLSVIVKIVGEACNLDCAYCYERRREYSGRRFMRPEVLSRFMEGFSNREISLELHGGEPLLAPRTLYRSIFATLRRHPRAVRVRMQTNATLLTRDWLAFLRDEWPDLRIGVSLDGDLTANILRYDRRGADSHEQVATALNLLSESGLEVGVIAVVTRRSLSRAADILSHFAGYSCIRIVKVVPSFDFGVRQGTGPVRSSKTLELMAHASEGRMEWAITPAEFTDFLIAAWQSWRGGQIYERFLLEPHVTIIRALHNQTMTDCHFSSRKCAHVLTLYPSGRVGTCDEIDQAGTTLGNAPSSDDAIIRFWTQSTLAANISSLLQRCAACSHHATCGGGCVATRLRLRSNGLEDAYCDHRKAIIDYIAAEIGFE